MKSGWFNEERSECLHCRTECSAFDMSPFGKVVVKGADSAKLLNFAVTANLANRENGSIVYTCFCNPQTGGVVGDLTVCKVSDDEFYCVLPGADAHVFERHLRKCRELLELSASSCPSDLITEDVAVLAVMGPKSRDVLKNAYPEVDFSDARFPFNSFQELESGVKLLRVSFVGELGWEIHAPVADNLAVSVYDSVFESAGKADVDLKDGGMFALLSSLRIEKGFVHNGHDLHPLATPAECGLGFTVDWKKGDFAGKSALEARKKEGMKERICTFIFPNDAENDYTPHGHHSDLVRDSDGEICGYLSSVGYSHTLNKPVALGFVELAKKGKGVKVKDFIEKSDFTVQLVKDAKAVKVPVKVQLACAVDPTGKRVQGDYS